MELDQEGKKKNTNNHQFIPKNFDFLKIRINRINVFTNAMKFSLRFITWEREMEKKRFSRTFQTSIVELQRTMRATIGVMRAELMKVRRAFSLDFQIW